METSNLELGNLIQGFKLSCQTEGKSQKTVEWYLCFLNRFQFVLQKEGISGHIGSITKDLGKLIRSHSSRSCESNQGFLWLAYQ